LGVPFDNLTKREALEQIEQMVASRQPHYLVTPNVDFLVQARKDIELRRILFEAHLVLCDGTPLVWASRLLGNPLPERVAGADIVPLLIEVAQKRCYRLFLLGATPDACSCAVIRLMKKHPELLIAGHYSPDFHPLLEMDHEEIKRRILEAKPDVLLVSFGCPKQEKWIAMHYRSLGVPVIAGVGATIDFLAGQVKRAPVWMGRMGLEWVFRLVQEPRRLFRRYLTDLWVFGGSILLQWWQLKLRAYGRRSYGALRAEGLAGGTGAKDPSAREPDWQHIRLPERLDFAAVSGGEIELDKLVDVNRHCVLDIRGVTFIDSTGVGFLIRLQKTIRAAGCELVLLNPSANVQRALALMRLQDFFLCARNIESAQEIIAAGSGEESTGVTRRSDASQTVLAWHGEITATNAEAIWQRTREHLAMLSSKEAATIDLAAVRFMDSTGLGLMVRIRKLSSQNKQAVHFINFQPAVRNVLRLARLEEFLLNSGESVASQTAVSLSEPNAHLDESAHTTQPATAH
jgi:N-acetylglucosaminyldiphosphoundecaprenol N-acetyl-beta-D-mannosaminyltransferase